MQRCASRSSRNGSTQTGWRLPDRSTAFQQRPYTAGAAGCWRRQSTIAPRPPASSQSSLLSQQTNGARPLAMPSLIAAAWPPSRLLRQPARRGAQRAITPIDSSVDPPSMTNTSTGRSWLKIEASASSR
jgi:hypothetical protein